MVTSEYFRSFIHKIKNHTERIVGVYVPEEEDIISRLKELKEDRKSILKFLRVSEAKRGRRIIEEIEKLKEREKIPIEIEIRHKSRLKALTEACEREKPELIITSKRYSKEKDEEVSHVVSELARKIDCSILIVG
mgnify:CR=1 FL=1